MHRKRVRIKKMRAESKDECREKRMESVTKERGYGSENGKRWKERELKEKHPAEERKSQETKD